MAQISRRRILAGGISATGLLLSGYPMSPTFAQSKYPDRPIKIVSPFVAGSVSDICLRVLSEKMSALTGTHSVIQNQVSPGGIAAAMAVKTVQPDGYTVALFSNATAVSAALFKTLPFDPLNDFRPVLGLSEFSYLMAVRTESSYRTAADIFDAARARPGSLNIGTSAAGTTPHLAAELLKAMAQINVTLVPYRGSGDLVLALTRGDVDLIIDTYAPLQQALASGQVRAVAVTGSERAPALMDVPTLQEAGIAGYDVSSWNAIYAPNGVPAEVSERLQELILIALKDPELQSRFSTLGVTVRAIRREDVDIRMRDEIAKWSKVIASAGIERQ